MSAKAALALLTLFSGLSLFACSEQADTPAASSEPSADAGARDGDGNGDGSADAATQGRDASADARGDDAGQWADATTQDADGSSPTLDGGDAGGNADAADEGPPPTAPLTAKDAAAAMGHGFNLGQMFESTQHPRTFEAAKGKIDAYYAKGYRNVRIPITWTENVGGNELVHDPAVGDVDRTHPRLAVITQIVDYALSLPGLYVVINAHHESALKTQSRDAVLQRLWHDIEDIFGDRDHRLLFEFLNEPHRDDTSPMPAADLRRMTGKAYAEVRARDPERIVLIGGNQWFGAGEVPAVWKNLDEVGGGDDPYVMATFHHYSPWSFCGDHQGTYDDPWTANDQSGPMDTMARWANDVGKGMPVYIGEWGVGWGSVYDVLRCNNIREWYTKFDSENAAPHGQPTAVWDDGGWFKIFDHGSGAFANNLADCILGSCAWDGSDRFNAGCR